MSECECVCECVSERERDRETETERRFFQVGCPYGKRKSYPYIQTVAISSMKIMPLGKVLNIEKYHITRS